MPYKLSNLRQAVEAPEAELPTRAARMLGVAASQLKRWRILRKSLDARSRRNLEFVYTLEVELADEADWAQRSKRSRDVAPYAPVPFDDPPPGEEPLETRPVVVGTGPAGLLAADYLAWKGYRPLILERGQGVKERVPAIREFDRGGPHDEENNYLFGEGGAGCFSDGKLTCRMTGPDVDWTLERFVECGGRPSIVYEHRPHLGSNRLPMICRNFRRQIEARGGEYRFGCRVEGLELLDGGIVGVRTSSGTIATRHVFLGIGHSARDTYRVLLEQGVPLRPKAFQLGLRIEHPQELVNREKYGKPEYLERLGAADYSLIARGEKDLFTFCMCAGGVIIPSISESRMFCSNGMSNSRHDSGYANSGLVVTLETHEFGNDHPLAGVEIQRRYESAAWELGDRDYRCPTQRANDFLSDRSPPPGERLITSYPRGSVARPLAGVVPPSILKALKTGLPLLGQNWRGDYLKEAILVGPEMRGSSPVRIDRDTVTRECPGIRGLFPIGEGAGYAGGIVSAAVDGLRSARELVRRFRALERL